MLTHMFGPEKILNLEDIDDVSFEDLILVLQQATSSETFIDIGQVVHTKVWRFYKDYRISSATDINNVPCKDHDVHEKMCEERWKTIYRKTDDLQASVNSMKGWLLAGLTTILISMFTLVLRGLI